ncbi:pyrimidine reductase family protein [Rhodococcus sp. X156]|uniref:pyrimidine reductase family protein n=1 Tax=Rhodococcus sp. X156 TaxID=2499145 RepID=UPI001F495349|nr:pyrimidine reductase family protein [Rhodococcus sp. X156]
MTTPGAADSNQADLSDAELRALYAYPPELVRPWVRVNFVSSVDGAVSVDGRTAGLATPSDQKVFALLRELADVIVVGAGTARAEGYRGARTNPELRRAREARGQAPVPPIAVVTASGNLAADAPLFTDTTVAPLVITTTRGAEAHGDALRAAGAQVHTAGVERVEPATLLAVLAEQGLYRVLCEGGPTLFGDLVTADLVDEVCLTTAPLLALGGAGRIATGPAGEPRGLSLGHVLCDDDATMLLRWVRRR